MEATHNISDAGLYTDFSGLQRLRTKVAGQKIAGQENSEQSSEATKEVAKQFESLFLQMMLKSMRDAIPTDESAESDQTRFYQDMFDKQIALDLANGKNGGGLGIAELLERDISTGKPQSQNEQGVADNYDLIKNQVNRSASLYKQNSTGLSQE